MYYKFIKALRWNTTAAFLYKTGLLLHQIALYSIVSQRFYGLTGTIFAIIYLTISLTNFGFEYTLLPFFAQATKSKNQFQQILYHLAARVIMVGIISLFFYAFLLHAPYTCIKNITSQCSPLVLGIMSCIFFIESIKKSVNTIMQLAFMNQAIATAEIAMLGSYIAMVWITYSIQKIVSLYTLLIPLLITASAELCFFLLLLIRFYKKLPDVPGKITKIPFLVLMQQRFYNFINQLTKTFFSPNFMILILATLFGFQKVGSIKVFTNTIALIYTFLNRTFGITSGATFSANRHLKQQDFQNLFIKITNNYFQALFVIAVACVGYISYYTTIVNSTNAIMIQVMPFFVISFLEYLVLTYEQLFLAKQAALQLAMINAINLIVLAIVVSYSLTMHMNKALFILLGMRVCSVAAISYTAFYLWNIKPKFSIDKTILCIGLILTCMLFIFF